jgi:phosphoglycolate phosphatase
VRLVLWDVDYTLVDTARRGRDAFDDAFRAVLGSVPEPVPFAGYTDRQIALAMIEKAGVEPPEEHLPALLERLAETLAARAEQIRAEGAVMPGVREALRALDRAPDVVQSLLTGNIEPNARVKLEVFGLGAELDWEAGGYGSDPHERRSDLVAVARGRAAAKHGVELPPQAAVLIGDTPLDVSAALEAGAGAVGVATGPYGVAELREAGAHAALEDLRDTAAVLEAVGAGELSPPAST